jgi:hypothetical protein
VDEVILLEFLTFTGKRKKGAGKRGISKSAGRTNGRAFAGLESRTSASHCDTADFEVCATGLPMKYPGSSPERDTGN